jgi:hypothetical protein
MFGTKKYTSVAGSLKTIYVEDGARGFYKAAHLPKLLRSLSQPS